MDKKNKKTKYHAAEQFCAAAEKEYEYERSRNATLDNKINMTLAFCGVVFAFLLDYLDIQSLVGDSHTCTTSPCLECSLRFVCIISRVLCVVLFAVCIYKLFLALKPRTYHYLDTNYLLDKKIDEVEPLQAYMYIGSKYTELTNLNCKANEERAGLYLKSIYCLLGSIAFCAISQAIEVNFLV